MWTPGGGLRVPGSLAGVFLRRCFFAPLALMSRNQCLCGEECPERRGPGAEDGSQQQWSANGSERLPGPPFARGPTHFQHRDRPMMWFAQQPVTDVVLPAINQRHDRKKYLVRGRCQKSCYNVA